MLIAGAKGFAKEILEILDQNNQLENLVFYDDIIGNKETLLYNKFPIIKTIEDAKLFFSQTCNKFSLGVGNPTLRRKLYDKFIAIGGEFSSTISKNAEIGSYDVHIENGCNILAGVKISNSVTIGKGAIIYYNSVITHDSHIGEFVEISPSTTLLGRCTIEDNVQLGAGSIIFPDITIGSNSVIGAGAVVSKSLPGHCVAVGVPAKIIKYLNDK